MSSQITDMNLTSINEMSNVSLVTHNSVQSVHADSVELQNASTNLIGLQSENYLEQFNSTFYLTTPQGQHEVELVFPTYIRVVSTGFCCLVFVIGVFGNLLVPIVLLRNKDMRNSTNIFLLNLSLADLFVLLVCLPTAFVELHSPPDVWLLGKGLCKAVRYVEYTVVHGSVLSLMAISLERYYVVCRPLQVNYLCTRTRANQVILMIWLTALASASPMLWIQSYDIVPYHDGTLQPVCLTIIASQWAYAFVYGASFLFFFLPLLLLVSVYTVITRQLLKDPLRFNPERNHPQMKSRRQVVVMLATVVLSFFVCLLPIRVLFLWILIVPQKEVQNLGIEGYYNLVYFCRIMYYLNSCVNPILYAFMSSRFRSEFHDVLSCCKKRNSKVVEPNTIFTGSGKKVPVLRYSSYFDSFRSSSSKGRMGCQLNSSSSSSNKVVRKCKSNPIMMPSKHIESFV